VSPTAAQRDSLPDTLIVADVGGTFARVALASVRAVQRHS